MYQEAFKNRTDLLQFGDNALLLFALTLKYGFDDIEQIAAESLTDGRDDKCADLILVNADEGYAVIAQSYNSKDTTKPSAKSGKAAQLSIAVNWILNAEEEALPDIIKSATLQLRNALLENRIKNIQIWYLHNLEESENCASELKLVEAAATDHLRQNFPLSEVQTVQAIEVGTKTISEWYRTTLTPILVSEKLEFQVLGGFEISSSDWTAFSTAISLGTLWKLFRNHEKDLFSANVRDYLGIIKSDLNINYNIKNTAKSDSEHFCVFNNGLTAITHDYRYDQDSKKLTVSGISIVNGAQTTGSVGTLDTAPSENSFVSARFIKCTSNETIQDIVRYCGFS